MSRPHCLNLAACAARKPTTHCRRCSIARVNASPDMLGKRVDNLRAKFKDPDFLAEHVERARQNISAAHAAVSHEEMLERMARARAASMAMIGTPEHKAARARAGKTHSARRLAWCPEDLRPYYRQLLRAAVPAAEARKIIEDQVAQRPREGAREVARISANLLAAEQKRRRDAY